MDGRSSTARFSVWRGAEHPTDNPLVPYLGCTHVLFVFMLTTIGRQFFPFFTTLFNTNKYIKGILDTVGEDTRSLATATTTTTTILTTTMMTTLTLLANLGKWKWKCTTARTGAPLHRCTRSSSLDPRPTLSAYPSIPSVVCDMDMDMDLDLDMDLDM